MSKTECCIKGCLSKSPSIKVKDIIYYLFPTDAAWASQWYKRIKEYDAEFNREKTSVVCSLHFAKSTMHPSTRHLVDHAIPVAFPSKAPPPSNGTAVTPTTMPTAHITRRGCCIRGCSTIFDGSTAIPGFRFPRNEKRRALWLYFLRLHNDQDLELQDVHRICGLHFPGGDFIANTNTLNEAANPSIFGAATQRRASEFTQKNTVARSNGSTMTPPSQPPSTSQAAPAPKATLMPPPPPLRRSLPVTSKVNTSNTMDKQSPVLVTKGLAQPSSSQSLLPRAVASAESIAKSQRNAASHVVQKAPGPLVSRRMSLPQRKLPTLTPKPINIAPQSAANNNVSISRPSTAPRSNVIFVQHNSAQPSKPVPTGIRPQAVSQANNLPPLSMGPVAPKIIGRMPAAGQNVFVYTSTPGQTPHIHAVSSANRTSSANQTTYVIRPPQSLLLPPPTNDVRVFKLANRRSSMAARPSDVVRTPPQAAYTNGSSTSTMPHNVTRGLQATNVVNTPPVFVAANSMQGNVAQPANQLSPTHEKIRIIQSPYVITSQKALAFPLMLLNRIKENEQVNADLSQEVAKMRTQYYDSIKESRLQNAPENIETIDIT